MSINVNLTLRQTGAEAKNAPLTNTEVDANFINLKTGIVSVESRVAALEAGGGSGGGSVDLSGLQTQINTVQSQINTVKSDGIRPNNVHRIKANTTLTDAYYGSLILLGDTVFAFNNQSLFPGGLYGSTLIKVGDIAAIGDLVANGSGGWKRLVQSPSNIAGNWADIPKPSNFTITLPKITSTNAGKVITLKNVGAMDVSVAASAGDICHGNGFGVFLIPSITAGYRSSLQRGASITITNDGVNKWFVVSDQDVGSVYYPAPSSAIQSVVGASAAFASYSSFYSNGYVIQEGGFLNGISAGEYKTIDYTLPQAYSYPADGSAGLAVVTSSIFGATGENFSIPSDPSTLSITQQQIFGDLDGIRYITGMRFHVKSTISQLIGIQYRASGPLVWGADIDTYGGN